MRNNLFLLVLLGILLINLASAEVWVSPKEPIIKGNNYVFITYNDSTLANTPVLMNISGPGDVLKSECEIILNEYGFGRCKYNFTSNDVSGTWSYGINTSDPGTFLVGKINMNLKDRSSLSSIKYGEKTTVEINFSYENFFPKEIARTSISYDAVTAYSTLPSLIDIDGNVAYNVVKALRKQKVRRVDRKSRLLKKEDVKNADIVIIVADNVRRKISKNQKVWKISDTSQSDYKGIIERTAEIKKRIKKLISMLK